MKNKILLILAFTLILSAQGTNLAFAFSSRKSDPIFRQPNKSPQTSQSDNKSHDWNEFNQSWHNELNNPQNQENEELNENTVSDFFPETQRSTEDLVNTNLQNEPSTATIPEPGTLALVSMGLLGGLFHKGRKKN